MRWMVAVGAGHSVSSSLSQHGSSVHDAHDVHIDTPKSVSSHPLPSLAYHQEPPKKPAPKTQKPLNEPVQNPLTPSLLSLPRSSSVLKVGQRWGFDACSFLNYCRRLAAHVPVHDKRPGTRLLSAVPMPPAFSLASSSVLPPELPEKSHGLGER